MAAMAKGVERGKPAAAPTAGGVRPVGVVDVGSTAVRLALAELLPDGSIHPVDQLHLSVSLGKDTFSGGEILPATQEACIRALRKFRTAAAQNRVTDAAALRAVATNAVREATNRLAFLDRVYMATGIDIEVIDSADVTRLTFLAVDAEIRRSPDLAAHDCLVLEIGGGSTEVLLIQNGYVTFSHTFRLGVLRLREQLEQQRLTAAQRQAMMESQILRTVAEVREALPEHKNLRLIVLGGDARFVAGRLTRPVSPDGAYVVPLPDWQRFCDELLELSDDEVVRRHHLSFEDAEVLAPATLAVALLARELGVSVLHVSRVSMREGLLMEMAGRGSWSGKFREQIVLSALELGRKYNFDEEHGRQVADLAVRIFGALREEHQLDDRYELVLYLAALLHEVGFFVSDRSHHKHSMYLILNSEIFGIGSRYMRIIALIARYHRRSPPQPTHEIYSTLSREERVIVSKLAAILRVADSLDRAHRRRVGAFTCRVEGRDFVLRLAGLDDLSHEQLALREKGEMFADVYGLRVVLRRAYASAGGKD